MPSRTHCPSEDAGGMAHVHSVSVKTQKLAAGVCDGRRVFVPLCETQMLGFGEQGIIGDELVAESVRESVEHGLRSQSSVPTKSHLYPALQPCESARNRSGETIVSP